MKTRKLLAMLLILAMMAGLLCTGAAANPSPAQVGTTGVYLCFGSPSKPETFPESTMSLGTPSGNVYDVVCSSSGYYPGELSLYVYDVDSSSNTVSLVTQDDDAVWFEIYDSNGDATKLQTINYSLNSNYNSTSGNYQNSNLFAVKIAAAGNVTVKKGNNTAFTLHFSNPVSNGTSPGRNPKTINGYLPIGQFATGTGWGSAYTDGNQYGATPGTIYKFVGGMNSTGVSLGMLGGYVQFELSVANMIKNDADNPYGVDFIVYGNAFSGNPEAAMVMVSEDGEEWYNLAGSLHYQAGTTKSMNASYIWITEANTTISSGSYSSTFPSKGVYFSSDYEPDDYTTASAAELAIAKATWTGIPSPNNTFTTPGVGFWPEYGDSADFTVKEGYNRVWNDGTVDATASSAAADAIGKVYWNKLGGAEVISYCGVSCVPDDAQAGLSGANATNYYRFGYADVRGNGSSPGTPINPYATLPTQQGGGDGFDLSWAVDEYGVPVSVNNVHFVRVYSSVLYNTGVFGETSAEVCGLYVVRGGGSGDAVAPDVTIDNMTDEDLEDFEIEKDITPISRNQQVVTFSGVGNNYATTFSLDVSGGTYIFINGESVSSKNITLGSGTVVAQIINQSGSAEPFITYVVMS